MATATVALKTFNSLTASPSEDLQESQVLQGNATLSATSTYITNGLPLVWTGLKNTGGATVFPQSMQTVPYDVDFRSTGGSGYDYIWDSTHNTLRLFTGGTEVATGDDIPAAVYADTIRFRAYFRKA
jgi:hypothetical protein